MVMNSIANKELEKAATAGDAEAQFTLANANADMV